jgi:hypothetical protein
MLARAVRGPEASDPKPVPLFGSPPAEVKGEAEKLLTEAVESDPSEQPLLEVVN